MSAFSIASPAELEKQVAGAALTSGADCAAVLAAIPDAEAFASGPCRIIFEQIRELANEGAPTDQLAVIRRLEQAGRLDEAGGRQYIDALAARVSISGSAGYYANEVVEAWRLRRVHDLGSRTRELRTLNGDCGALIEETSEIHAETAREAIRTADLSRVRPIRWAWDRRLPIGYLLLLVGAEGIGKGTLLAWVVSQLTRGKLPGAFAGEPARILIFGDEDAFDSVWVPRFYAAGADLDLIDIYEGPFSTAQGAASLRKIVEGGDYRLIVFDQLLDNMGSDLDDWRQLDVRHALRPIRTVARDLDVAMLGCLHPNKGQRGTFRDLMSGSVAYNALSRSSLLLGLHPDDEDRRVLVRGKGNLSSEPPSIEFSIEGRNLEVNGFNFDLPVVSDVVEGDLTIKDLLAPQREAPVRDGLADEIDAIGTGEVQRRADIARAVGRSNDDRSVGRALDQLEDEGRWRKVGRGKYQAVRLGIGISKEMPMPNEPATGGGAS